MTSSPPPTPTSPPPPARQRDRRRRLGVALLACALGAVAFALVLAVTDPPGPGLDPDAMAYLGAAASLARSGRYDVPTASWASDDTVAPLTHFPPGFPTAIAAPVRLGMPPEQGARLVVALSAFATVAIAAWLVGTAASVWAALLAAVMLGATPALVNAHLSVLSEPLFLACLTGALTLMARPSAPAGGAPPGAGRAVALGGVAAAAALVRYAGIAVPAAAALWLVLERPAAPWRARLRNASLAALPAVLLVGAWGARNARLLGGGPADPPSQRPPYLAGFADDLRLGAHTMRDWLAPQVEPERLQALVAVVALVLVAVAGGAVVLRAINGAGGAGGAGGSASARRRAAAAVRALAAAALLLVAYAGEVVASRLFVYGTIPFDERILAPVMLLVELTAATALGAWWRVRAGRRGARRLSSLAVRAAAAVAVAAWLGGSASITGDNVAYVVENGSDFAGTEWRQSRLLDYVRSRAADRALYSNWPSAIYFHTGRPARDLPNVLDSATLAQFSQRLAATSDSIARRLRLRRAARFDDGSAWELRRTRPAPRAAPSPQRAVRP